MSKEKEGQESSPVEWTYAQAVDNVGAGRYQVFLIGLLVLVSYTTSANNQSNIFIGGNMNHICKTPDHLSRGDNSSNNITYIADTCTLTTVVTSSVNSSNITNLTEPCKEWIYSSPAYTNTIMSEWDLNSCEDQGKWKIAFANSMYMIGFLVGCIVIGELSDRYGRRKLLVISGAGLVLSGIGASFAVNIPMFVIMRFFLGVFTAGARNTAYISIAEICPSSWRTVGALLPGFGYSLTAMLDVLNIYSLRDWRWYELATAISFSWFLLYWWLIPESPRWLLVTGQKKEVLKYFKFSAKINKRDLPENLNIRLGFKNEKAVALKVLFSTPNLRLTTIALGTLWCSASVISFTVAYNIGNLGQGIYLNIMIMHSIALMMDVAVIFYVKMGRRPALFSSFLWTTLAAILLAVLDTGTTKVIIAAIGYSLTGFCFSYLYLMTSELYPTTARVTALGVGSSLARVGGAFAPYVVLTNDTWPSLPYIIIGSIAALSSLISFFLPETMHKPLPDTLQVAERTSKLAATCHFMRPCGVHPPEFGEGTADFERNCSENLNDVISMSKSEEK